MNWYKKAQEEQVNDLECPECGSTLRFVPDGKFGPFYSCPNCPVTHSALKSGKPRGIPGNLETIALRKAAHNKMTELEDLYVRLYKKDKKEATKAIYRWLAKRMVCPTNKCHMSLFNKEQLQQAIGICEFEAHKMRKRLDNSPQLEFGI